MIRHALIAALTAVIALGGLAWWQRGQLAARQAENERLSRSVGALTLQAEHSALARQVEAARADAARRRADALGAEIDAILKGGIPDAPLHPDLADLLNGRSLRPDD